MIKVNKFQSINSFQVEAASNYLNEGIQVSSAMNTFVQQLRAIQTCLWRALNSWSVDKLCLGTKWW